MKKNLMTTMVIIITASMLAGCAEAQPKESATDTATEVTSVATTEDTTEGSTKDTTEDTTKDTTVGSTEDTTEGSIEAVAKNEDGANDEASNYDDIITDISYLDDGLDYHVLDLYGTQSSTEATPVVIEVHGGGFIGGKKENNAAHCITFAKNGYKAVALEYGKVPREGDFTSAIQDLFAAYQWVADHAEEYHFDLDNIFLSGDSAGGYYVLLTNAIFHSEDLQEYFGVTLPSYKFTSYITTCPAADILAMQDNFNKESGPDAHTAKTIGKELLFNEDLMNHMDLFSNVDATAFEGVYLMTTPDDTVTGDSVIKFDQYLTEQGIDHVFHSYEAKTNKLQHTFNISHPDYEESILANQDMVDYMNSLLK